MPTPLVKRIKLNAPFGKGDTWSLVPQPALFWSIQWTVRLTFLLRPPLIMTWKKGVGWKQSCVFIMTVQLLSTIYLKLKSRGLIVLDRDTLLF